MGSDSRLAILAVALGEVLGQDRRRRGDDQGNDDHDGLHGVSPVGFGPRLARHVAVGKRVGEDGRGRGDDQGDSEDELLHGGSPIDIEVGRLIFRSAGWPGCRSNK